MREAGFYLVKTKLDGWVVGMWDVTRNEWETMDRFGLTDDEFIEIDERRIVREEVK